MKRQVQIKLEVCGLTPEEMSIFYLAVEERIKDVMDLLGCDLVNKEEK